MTEHQSETKGKNFVVAALYKFVNLPDVRELKLHLLAICKDNHIKGTILLAGEGINATIAGSRQGIDTLKNFLEEDGRFTGLEYKESFASQVPFYRMKVKLKQEIVTMGISGIDPVRSSGIRVDAEQWNRLLSDPEVLVLDTRNQYEYEVGTFRNAVSPYLDSFRDFPQYVKDNLDRNKHRKVAMFCTGGIRCEKASAYMVEQGFEEVYQLQGGILKYLEEVQADRNLWCGECFVFDNRVTVDEALNEGEHEQCFACRRPVSKEDMSSEKYQQGVSCPRCYDSLTTKRRDSLEERQKQVELATERGQLHVGATIPAVK